MGVNWINLAHYWDYWQDHLAKVRNLLNRTYIRWTTRQPPAYHDCIWLYRSYGEKSGGRNPHPSATPPLPVTRSPPSPSSTLRYTPLHSSSYSVPEDAGSGQPVWSGGHKTWQYKRGRTAGSWERSHPPYIWEQFPWSHYTQMEYRNQAKCKIINMFIDDMTQWPSHGKYCPFRKQHRVVW